MDQYDCDGRCVDGNHTELRKTLNDDDRNPQYIETVHRRGYRFIFPLATITPPIVSRQLSVISKQTPPAPPQLATGLVGRESELAQLQSWLDKALNGERQIVFVTGEPGIGKTALVEAFLQRLESRVQDLESEQVQSHEENQKVKVEAQFPTPAPRLPISAPWIGRGQCIENHGAGEAYMPILEALGRLCRAPGGDHLIVLLSQYAPTWLVQLSMLLNADELAALQPRVQGVTRGRMLREMAETLEALTAERPLVLVLEDLHWSDTSTLDLLAALARRKERARLLVLGTYRPVEMLNDGHLLNNVMQELQAHTLCTELELGLLNAADIAAYLRMRFPESVFPTGLAQALSQRTEGNPLFLVNVVEDLVAQGVLVLENSCWALQGDLEAIAMEVPKSIRQLIARQSARLLPAEQHVLEAASMTGMEFSAAAVAAALEENAIVVEEKCAGLANRQHFLRPVGLSEWPDGTVAARYAFLHALYQQLWHERVSPGRLQQWHQRIGERKEAAYGARAGEIAAELAVHFEQGRNYRRALHYFQQAAQNALQRSAHTEAIAHLTKGLELLTTLPDTPERRQQELGLQMALGPALMATKGFAVPEVEKSFARARELCERIGSTPQLFPVLVGISSFYVLQGKLQIGRELREQLLRLAHETQDPARLLEAHNSLGTVLFFLGEFSLARTHLEQGIVLYDPRQHSPQAFLHKQDPLVICCTYLALILWHLGYPQQALERMQQALNRARELSHPFSLALALPFASMLHLYRRETQVTQELGEATIALCTQHGFPLFLSMGTLYRGWALAKQGQGEQGIAQMRQGLTVYQATGQEAGQPHYLTLLAEAYGNTGQVEEGLNVLAEALAVAHKNGEHRSEAELYRLHGELMLQQENQKAKIKRQKSKIKTDPRSLTPDPQSEAEADFLKAIDIARQQQAKSLELRAAMSLARLWRQQGKQHEARDMLSELYNWFTEGFDTKDLQEAKALLEELQ
jgi:predicted ATPase